MEGVEQTFLVGGILTALGILATKISSRASVPGLVLFLLVGMLAGSEGIGGIRFDDYVSAYNIGVVALAVILFDGGLRTSFSAIRRVWRPAGILATIGVLMTAAGTGVAAAYLLNLPLVSGLLIGAIISSTDAAAVFFILRKQGIRLKGRLAATLEVESGSNDPMAVLLTIVVAQYASGEASSALEMLTFFVGQMGIGAAAGVAGGALGGRLINRVKLDSPGLYPVLVGAVGAMVFGATALLGGSGFLAVYIAGIFIGNQPVVFREGILHFHDGAAWVAQILMFTLLGLLSTPSSLMQVAIPGLSIAFVLVFISRPLTVLLTMIPFGYSRNELLLISWVGLKGAVPIILAIYPLTRDIPDAQLIFDVVFFVVIVSALVQGWSLPGVARRLDLQMPPEVEPPVLLELTALRHIDAEILGFHITSSSRGAGHRLVDLPLPEGAVVAVISHDQDVIPPTGIYRLKAGDYVYIVCRRDLRRAVELLFRPLSDDPPDDPLPLFYEIALRGQVSLDRLHHFFGIDLNGDANATLAEVLQSSLSEAPTVADFVERDGALLVVRGVEGGRVSWVGVRRTGTSLDG